MRLATVARHREADSATCGSSVDIANPPPPRLLRPKQPHYLAVDVEAEVPAEQGQEGGATAFSWGESTK
jgi:hypothetical protein